MNRNNIPERWKFLKLKNIAKEVNIKATKQHSYEVFSVTKYDGFVRSSDYFKKQVFSRDTSNYKVVKPNQFAYATIHLDEGSIGLLNYHTPVIISPMYKVFEVNNSVVYNPYLLRLLKSSRMLAQYALLGSGSVHRRKAISFHKLGSIEIPLPPLEEQKRIAAILDKADAIRRKRKEAIRLTEELLQSTFLDMFGDPVGKNEKWEQHNLGDLVSIVSGQINPQNEPYIDMPHIGGENIESNTGFIHKVQTPRELNLKSGKYSFKSTDILYSKIRPYLNKVSIPSFSGICSADIYPLRVNEKMADKHYLVYLLRSDEFLSYTDKHSARTNIPKINRSALLKFSSKLPPLELQKKFSQVYKKVDYMKKNSSSILQESNNLFNSLLQKAFRGEL